MIRVQSQCPTFPAYQRSSATVPTVDGVSYPLACDTHHPRRRDRCPCRAIVLGGQEGLSQLYRYRHPASCTYFALRSTFP